MARNQTLDTSINLQVTNCEIKMRSNLYALYAHRDDKGGIFYIGTGNLARPFDVRRRSLEWRRYAGLAREFTIEVWLTATSIEPLRRIEFELIQALRPCCNFTNGTGMTAKQETKEEVLNLIKVKTL